MTRTYWILDPEQVRCLASPARHDIVDRLAADGPLSVRELAAAIGRNPSALYHHLERLLAVGLVVEAGTRAAHRRAEKLYATPAPRMRLLRALARPDLREPVVDAAAALCRQMERDVRDGLGADDAVTEGPSRNVGFFRLVAAPDEDALRQINDHLDAIAELLWTRHSPDAPLVALGWTLAPVRPSKE